MASNQNSNGGGSQFTLSKWQMAVLLGIGVGVGGAVYYYYSRRGQTKQLSEDTKVTEGSSTEQRHANEKDDVDFNMSAKDQAAARKQKGNKFFRGGRFDLAIQCYTQAIEVCPAEENEIKSMIYQNRAAAYEQIKDYTQVVEDCDKALELNRLYVKAIGRRSRAYEELGEHRKCLEDLTAQCILEKFENAATIIAADRVLKVVGKTEAKKKFAERQYFLPSNAFIQTYLDSFANDGLQLASIADGAAVDTSTFEEEDYYLFARYDLSQCKYDDIISNCSKEIEKESSPYRAEAYCLRGTFYLLMTDFDAAVKDLNEVLQLDEASSRVKLNALIKRASYKLQQDEAIDALKDFDEAIALDSENCDVYYHRGQAYFLLERLSEAILDFQKSFDLNNNFAQAYVHLGYARYKSAVTQQSMSLTEKALQTFEDAIVRFPNSADVTSLYAQILQDQQKLDKADELFDKAISIRPNFPNYYVHKGVLLVQMKQDLEGGVKLIEKAIEIDSKCDFAYETLATVEVQKGQIQKGIELFKKAVSLARSESDLSHTLSLLIAAETQIEIGRKLGLSPVMPF